MPGNYATLATVYNDLGLDDFARRMTGVLVDFAQRRDWLGRRIVVLGCGTGASMEYLSNYMFNVTGVDNSPEMLEIAQHRFTDTNANLRWIEADMRELGNQVGTAEMVLALDVLNELNSLRDLEIVFANVARILEPGKLLMFDLFTLQGLTERGLSGDTLIADQDDLIAFSSNDYDYERQITTTQYRIFRRQGASWEYSRAQRVLRGFPVQAVASLLQRTGLKVSGIYQLSLEPYDPGVSQAARVIFLVEKP